jgi:hypothetical protein
LRCRHTASQKTMSNVHLTTLRLSS